MIKKKILILGSTGSIGKNTLKILSKDKKNFDIKLLSTNSNSKLLISQAKKFNVKNLIINDYNEYVVAKKNIKILRLIFLILLKSFKNYFLKPKLIMQ